MRTTGDGTGSSSRSSRWPPRKRDDEDFIRRLINLYRLGAGFETIHQVWEIVRDIDIRAVLPSIQAPTLVLYRADNLTQNPAQGRYIADSIPGALFVNLPGADFEACTGDQDALLDEVQEFLTGTGYRPGADDRDVHRHCRVHPAGGRTR